MLACASLWSIAGIFIKLISCSGFVIAGFRGLFAALVTAVYIKAGGIGFKWNKAVFRTAVFMCLLFTAFVVSNKLTTAANAIVLQFTTPIWIMLYESLVMKKRLEGKDIIAAVCTLLGIALCFFDKLDGGRMLGNCIAVFAGLMMAFMYICLGTGSEQEKINGTFFGHLFTAAAGIPFILFTKNELNPRAFLFLVILGVVQLGIPYILLNFSSKTCPPLACSLLGAVEPLLNPLWVALFDGEMPGPLAFAGGLVVIITVTAWCILDARKPKAA